MQVIREEVLGMRGGWVIKGRVVVYNGRHEQRRVEMVIEKVGNVQFQEVGWTIQELAELHNTLVKWKTKIGEP